MLGFLANILGGGLAKELRRAIEARTNAQTEQERIRADAYVAEIEARTQRALSGGRMVTWVQVVWAGIYLVYDAKLVLWDKVLGWGVTDPLSPELLSHQAMVMAFLFGTNAALRILGR